MYELTGTVKMVNDIVTFPSGFSKREFVVTTEDKYPQDIKLSCLKDKASLLDGVSEGDQVKVSFDIRGNESRKNPGQYFVDLAAWRIDRQGGSGAGAAPAAGSAASSAPTSTEETFDDDMPF